MFEKCVLKLKQKKISKKLRTNFSKKKPDEDSQTNNKNNTETKIDSKILKNFENYKNFIKKFNFKKLSQQISNRSQQNKEIFKIQNEIHPFLFNKEKIPSKYKMRNIKKKLIESNLFFPKEENPNSNINLNNESNMSLNENYNIFSYNSDKNKNKNPSFSLMKIDDDDHSILKNYEKNINKEKFDRNRKIELERVNERLSIQKKHTSFKIDEDVKYKNNNHDIEKDDKSYESILSTSHVRKYTNSELTEKSNINKNISEMTAEELNEKNNNLNFLDLKEKINRMNYQVYTLVSQDYLFRQPIIFKEINLIIREIIAARNENNNIQEEIKNIKNSNINLNNQPINQTINNNIPKLNENFSINASKNKNESKKSLQNLSYNNIQNSPIEINKNLKKDIVNQDNNTQNKTYNLIKNINNTKINDIKENQSISGDASNNQYFTEKSYSNFDSECSNHTLVKDPSVKNLPSHVDLLENSKKIIDIKDDQSELKENIVFSIVKPESILDINNKSNLFNKESVNLKVINNSNESNYFMNCVSRCALM